jgi:chloramphenicol-sensitive protein RarD
MGLLQYIAPTIQFLIGVLIFQEPFTIPSLIGYSMIWLALVLFSGENLINNRHQRSINRAEKVSHAPIGD